MNCTAPVSVGELFDKISILRVKLKKITDPAKIPLVTAEHESLCTAARPLLARDPRLEPFLHELESLNEKLWNILQDQRAKEHQKEFDQTFVSLSRLVYQTNDKRFEIKNQINEIASSEIREQKHYPR